METQLDTRPDTALQTTPAATPTARPARITWLRPSVDVWANDAETVLVLDVPGVPPAELEVKAEGQTLTVTGVRRGGTTGWRRAFTLPRTVDTERIGARAENGVLTITLPVVEAARPRRIEVR